ncbi:MAG TPA: SIR2 family protein, partial [Myxococcota bacterium]|nr:SIR2 family protein [Myxococcota bacterium]
MTLPTRRFPTVGERFKRLLGALLGQTCVPFLGAGISRPAKLDESLPEGAAAWGEAPHGNSMNRKLAFAVLDDARGDARWWAHVDSVASKRLPRDPLTREILPPAAAPLGGFDVREALLLRLEAVERDGVVRHVAAERRTRRARSARRRSGLRARLDAAERALPLWYRQIAVLLGVSSPLATLSELLASRRGYVELCETLHLHAFVHVRPTAAHMAIARLLLERRVREVITTNYDTALERATEELSGSGARALDVVRTATEYMGRRSDGPGARPVCYKINGCAGEWAGSRQTEAGRDEVARRMILTERQLQTLERSRWADGLVRDRARQAHLIFSGFGTEEPQIRHTVLAIAQEFEVGVREPTSDGDIWSLGAAPWLHAFDPALTFFQMQVLRGWQLAWRREPDPNEPENWFGAEDRRAFLLGDRQGLTADSFWITVLLGLWGRIATRAWAADGPLRAAVTDGGGEGEQRRRSTWRGSGKSCLIWNA